MLKLRNSNRQLDFKDAIPSRSIAQNVGKAFDRKSTNATDSMLQIRTPTLLLPICIEFEMLFARRGKAKRKKIAAGVLLERDVSVTMRDGVCLKVNVFRPKIDGPFAVLVSVTPYGKDKLPDRIGMLFMRLAGVRFGCLQCSRERDARPLDDDWWASKRPDLERINTPALVCGSWSDQGLHTRGSLIGFERIGSDQKWLFTHGRREAFFCGYNGFAQDFVAKGWLRVSHRTLDPDLSGPGRPRHTHRDIELVKPGEIVPVRIEVLASSTLFEPGSHLGLDILGQDGARYAAFRHKRRVNLGLHTIHTGGRFGSCLQIPVVDGS